MGSEDEAGQSQKVVRMKPKWIKMPNGRLIRYVPDTLEMFLAETDLPAVSMPSIDYAMTGSATPVERHQEQYDTQDFDVRKLGGLEITIFGAGAVGSHVSFFLGPAQLVQNVIDFKKVEHKHTQSGRTIYDPFLTGLKKVDALKRKLEREHVGTTVNPLPYNVVEIPDIELRLMASRSALVVLAIDDPRQILRISDLVYPVVDLIQIAMHAGALSGHIAMTVPYVTPCLRCTLGVENPTDIHRLDSEPGSSWHVTRVAHEAASIAIDIMYSKVTSEAITRWDTSKNLIYVANTKQELSPDGPGIRFEGSQKRPGCPVCDI